MVTNEESGDCLRDSELAIQIDQLLSSCQFKSAVFWADKRLSLALLDNPRPLVQFAHFLRVLISASEWQRAVAFVTAQRLSSLHLIFAHYTATALYYAKMYHGVTTLPIAHLVSWEEVNLFAETAYNAMEKRPSTEEKAQLDAMLQGNLIESSLLMTFARSFYKQKNRQMAAECARLALRKNAICYEALDFIVHCYLIKANGLAGFLESLKIEGPLADFIRQNYECKININTPTLSPSARQLSELLNSDMSIRCSKALQLFNNGCIKEAHDITTKIMKETGANEECLLVHIATLVEQRKTHSLFELGHIISNRDPDSYLGWYCIACYYFCTGNTTLAKQYFDKSTTYNGLFVEGWVAFGHLLASESEHEQATNCYLQAARLVEGDYRPILYVGVQYSFQLNADRARQFLRDAAELAGENAHILHEQGSHAYSQNAYHEAEDYFLRALKILCTEKGAKELDAMLNCRLPVFWEPLVNNLGHCYRKLGKYENALACHRKSLLMIPNRASTLGAIAMNYLCLGQMEEGTDTLHGALSMTPNDEVLKQALTATVDLLERCPRLSKRTPAFLLDSGKFTLKSEDLVLKGEEVEMDNDSALFPTSKKSTKSEDTPALRRSTRQRVLASMANESNRSDDMDLS